MFCYGAGYENGRLAPEEQKISVNLSSAYMLPWQKQLWDSTGCLLALGTEWQKVVRRGRFVASVGDQNRDQVRLPSVLLQRWGFDMGVQRKKRRSVCTLSGFLAGMIS